MHVCIHGTFGKHALSLKPLDRPEAFNLLHTKDLMIQNSPGRSAWIPKAQNSPKALCTMVFGPQSLEISVLRALGNEWLVPIFRRPPNDLKFARLSTVRSGT